MFGYVGINNEELKVKDLKRYKAYYCGLCEELGSKYGGRGRLTLSYDMTFLAILLTGVYEKTPKLSTLRCTKHMGKKHESLTNEFTEYAADMNILLSYYNLLDNWVDEKKVTSEVMVKALQKHVDKISSTYERQSTAVRTYIDKLSAFEKEGKADIDIPAGYTGEMLSEIFVYKEDEWSDTLRAMGFYLGKFIYLMDAYEDIKKDKETGNYNPFKNIWADEDFDDKAYDILTMMVAECARQFEMLPIIEEVEILRNILYSGIWSKYVAIKNKRMKGTEQ